MADQFARDEQGNRFVFDRRAGEFVPAAEGVGEALATGVGEWLTETGGGMLDAMGDVIGSGVIPGLVMPGMAQEGVERGATMFREQFTDQPARDRARAAYPQAQAIGQLAPDVLSLLPAVGPLARGGAALGAAAGRRLPDRVREGIQSASDRVRGRAAAARGAQADQFGQGSVGAAQIPGGGGPAQRRPLEGMLTADELEAELGEGLLTPARRAGLDAADEPSLGNAEAAMKREQFSMDEDKVFGGPLRQSDEALEEAASSMVMRRLGEPNATRLTPAVRGRISNEIGDRLDAAYAAAGNKIELDASELSQLNGVMKYVPAADERVVSREIENIFGDLGEKGHLTNTEFTTARQRLGKGASDAFNSGHTARGHALMDIRDQLDSALYRKIGPDEWDEFTKANEAFQLLKALEARAVTDPGGKINMRSLLTKYAAANRLFKSGRAHAEGDQFAKVMSTLEFVMHKRAPSSGTTERLLANLPKAGATAGASALGLGALNSLGILD